MPEGAPQHEAAEQDYEALGRQILSDMGIEDPTFGSIAVTAGDAEGKCVGTMAEAVGRHSIVRDSLQEIVDDARGEGISVEEAAANDRMFRKFLLKDDDTGEIVRVDSSEELKKN